MIQSLITIQALLEARKLTTKDWSIEDSVSSETVSRHLQIKWWLGISTNLMGYLIVAGCVALAAAMSKSLTDKNWSTTEYSSLINSQLLDQEGRSMLAPYKRGVLLSLKAIKLPLNSNVLDSEKVFISKKVSTVRVLTWCSLWQHFRIVFQALTESHSSMWSYINAARKVMSAKDRQFQKST